MAWTGVTNNQSPSINDLQNAVDTGVFTVKNAGQKPSTTNNPSPTKDQILPWLNCTITTSAGNKLPRKDEIFPITNYTVVNGMPRANSDWPCTYTLTTQYYRRNSDGMIFTDTGLTTVAPDRTLIDLSTIDTPPAISSSTGGSTNVALGSKAFKPTIGNPVTLTGLGLGVTGGGNVSATGRYLYVEIGKQYRVTATLTATNNTSKTWRAEAHINNSGTNNLGAPNVASTVNSVSQGTFTASACETWSVYGWPATNDTDWSGTCTIVVEKLN